MRVIFFFQSYALHNRKKKLKKKGGRSCFEEAQDSYGLEANDRHGLRRDNPNALQERERETEEFKVQKVNEAGEMWDSSERKSGFNS